MIIVLFVVNKICYTHAHVYADGTVQTHAHPYSKSANSDNNRQHQHSALELVLFDILDILFLLSFFVFGYLGLSSTTSKIEELTNQLPRLLFSNKKGRDPPFLLLS